VVVALIDDVGFDSSSSAFGGPINTPYGGASGERRPEVLAVPDRIQSRIIEI